jgi:hypothetical protein
MYVSEQVAEILLQAGAHPEMAFYRACSSGHEGVASLCIGAFTTRQAAEFIHPRTGFSAIQAARELDLGGMARRLQAQVDAKFGSEQTDLTQAGLD